MADDEKPDELEEHVRINQENLKASFGPDFAAVLEAQHKVDELLSALINKVLAAEGETDQRLNLNLLKFFSDGFADRGAFWGGCASINYGVPPTSVYGALQAATFEGMEKAVRVHQEDCTDPTCRASVDLARFLAGIHQMTSCAREAVEAIQNNMPKKHLH